MAEPQSVVALFIRHDGYVCAVTRRHKPEDLSLPGGSINPGEDPIMACLREIREELSADVRVLAIQFTYERVDEVDGNVAWVFEVLDWTGEPRQNEDGILVSWEKPRRLLEPNCTFREYNRKLFKHVGLI